MTSRGKMFKWLKDVCQFTHSELDRMDDLTILDPLFNLLLALSDKEESELILNMIAIRLHSILLYEMSSTDWIRCTHRIHMIMKYFENERIISDEPVVRYSNINEFSIMINFKMVMKTTIYNIVIHHDRVSVTVKEN